MQTIIPIAATSEIVLHQYYDSFVRRDGDPPASALLLGYDSEPIRAERSLWDLARWARERPELAHWLTATPAVDIVRDLALAGPGSCGGRDPGPRITSGSPTHLDTFGHAVYNLDFANPVPADDPAPLVDVVRLYLTGQAGDPYERQRRLQQKRDAATVVIRLGWTRCAAAPSTRCCAGPRPSPPSGRTRSPTWAGLAAAAPDAGRARATGWSPPGAVDRPDDVYWCRRPEIEAALGTPRTCGRLEQRREVWRGQRRATPPQLLPRDPGWIGWAR